MKNIYLLFLVFALLSNVSFGQLQSDQSDAVWSIVMPVTESNDVDMEKCLLSSVKDSLVIDFIRNEGSHRFRVDSIYFTGADADAFSLVSGIPKYTLEANAKHFTEFRFIPKRVGIHNAQIVIITQADTLYQKIQGEGVAPDLSVLNDFINFGQVNVGSRKDTLQVATIQNIGTSPLLITNTNHNKPNDYDFSTIAGGGSFTINPGDIKEIDLRFEPSSDGRTSGILEFHYNGTGSPAIVQLFGEGVRRFPRITVTADDFPDILCENSVSRDFPVRNIGGDVLVINNIDFEGIDKDDFEVNETFPIEIQQGMTGIIKVNFVPKSHGEKNANLRLHSNSVPDSVFTLPIKALKESAEFATDKSEIDLGILLLNSPKSSNITITNTGSMTNTFQITLAAGITANPNSFTLSPGESRNVGITFEGFDEPLNLNEKLIITEELCSNEKVIDVIGTVSAVFADIAVNDISAYAGDLITVPIIMQNQSNLSLSGATSIKADLLFNPTLLFPKDYQFVKIDDYNAKLSLINLPVNISNGETLADVRFVVGLGNAESCELTLSNVEIVSGYGDINLKSGKFTLLGICEEGNSPRLFNPFGLAGITNISPNPAENRISIHAAFSESGLTEILIFNVMGEVVEKVFSQSIQQETEINIDVDLSRFGSGTYQLIFRSPTYIESRKIVVIK